MPQGGCCHREILLKAWPFPSSMVETAPCKISKAFCRFGRTSPSLPKPPLIFHFQVQVFEADNQATES